MNINDIREEFPQLQIKNKNGFPLIYFDNAATTLKPKRVIKALSDVYLNSFGNANRGAHEMSVNASSIFENTRNNIKEFIGAENSGNIIFTKGATESLNIIASSYGKVILKENDYVLIGIDSHHANLVTWQEVCKYTGAKLLYFYVDENGEIDYIDLEKKLLNKPKLVSFTPITNTFGVIHDYKKIISMSKSIGAKVIIDGSQSMTHIKFDVKKDNIDFLVFSGHKVLAPQGIGVLYVNDNIINDMNPFLYGGDMIDYVYEDSSTYKKNFELFEGGTQNTSAVCGLNEAINYINEMGISKIINYENMLRDYFIEKFLSMDKFILYGPKEKNHRSSLFSFNIKECHPHDVSTILDTFGIAIRSGNHCCQPFMRSLKLNSTCRASLYFYNTKEEIDYFFDKIVEVRKILGF